ncbi:MAG: ribosome biogenesis GTP-binding protein YihA/YsxC [Longimicrobiales bacterium]
MRIHSAEFAGAIASPDGSPPDSLPEIVFAGRSNVGKSTLINHVLGRTRHKLARVSTTPGKTQEINFYRVQAESEPGTRSEFFLVDLPGYGYARAPAAVREAWKPLIEGYLSSSERVRGAVQLIDARRGPSSEDRQMVGYIAELEVPALVVLTKMDKLKRSERQRRVARVRTELGLDADQVLPFSARTNEGRDELLAAIDVLLLGAG